VNVNGTLNVLELARRYPNQIQRVVCASSNITLSNKPTVYKDTKLAVESLIGLYHTLGVSCMGLRPSNIYGTGQSKEEYQPCAFAGLDKGYMEKKYFSITGDGTQARDWVHASDVAQAFRLALNSPISGITIDVCTGALYSMNEVARLLDVPIVYTPARPGDAKVLISDPSPAFSLLRFKSQIDLEDGIWDAFPGVKNETSDNGE
jgi:nucleoside-diphosphate-sugar epimerase